MSNRSRRPDRVVRFYGNVDFALDTLAHCEITFIHASKLNDPFDPSITFETNFDADYDALLNYVRRSRPNQLGQFQAYMSRESWNIAVRNIKEYQQKLVSATFVFSCSGVLQDLHPKNNMYMWGHYGNGHRGVAIEFDTVKTSSLLNRFDSTFRENVSSEEAWSRVIYASTTNALSPNVFVDFVLADLGNQDLYATDLARTFGKQPITKSLAWRQENEWRVMWRNDETALKFHRAPIPADAIVNVYIGLQAAKSIEGDVVFEVRRNFPNVTIFRCARKIGFTELEFIKL